MIRNPKDFWSGVLFVIIGGASFGIARHYPMGSTTRMGPSYFPSVLGALLVLIGLITLVRGLVTHGERIVGLAWKPALYVTGATLLFGLLMRGAGLAPAIIVLVVLSAWASKHFSWTAAVSLAVLLTVFSILIFVKALGLPMPVLGGWLGG